MAEAPSDAPTVLFTDVVGSTDLANRVGDQESRRMLETHEGVIREEVARGGGREVKTMGDGFMVAFPEPRAALLAAVAIQRRLHEEVPGVLVRMGLHAGEVMERNRDLFGATVNAAARISGLARGGQILISDELAGATELDGTTTLDRGLFWLKGFPERWRLHELRWGTTPSVADETRTPYVGREQELADLRRHLEEALAGHGSLVLIGGEPGVGKTRLAQELAAEADRHGARVLVGHCSDIEGALPYVAWVEILEQAVVRARSPEALRELLGESAPEIARVVPELRRMFDDIPPPMDLPAEQERRFLFNSIRDFIARAAEIRPLMLILDDLHWADEPSLILLEHLAEALGDIPALVVGTYRDVELEVDRPLARTLEELLRRRLAERISLHRMDRDGVAAILQGLAGERPPPGIVGAVFAETEGNAFFVEEVFRHLMEEGRLLDRDGRWRPDVRVSEVNVPESVRLVIGRRLQRLPEEARKVLASAATIGRFFEIPLLEAVSGAGEDELLEAVEAAEAARLVAPTPDDPDRYEFSHELVRQTLLAGQSALRRQRLHRRVAEAIEARLGDRSEDRAEDLVHHLLNAGSGISTDKLLRYLMVAGRRAMDAAAWEDALDHFESAVGLTEGNPQGRAEALVGLGFAVRSLGRVEESTTAWRDALDIYSELGDTEAVAELCANLAFDLGYSGRTMQGIEFVQRGLVASEGMRNPARVQLLAAGMGYLAWGGDLQGSLAMEREALDLARELGDRSLEAFVIGGRATVNYLFMDLSGVLEAGRRALDMGLFQDRLWERTLLQGLMEFAALNRGEMELARTIGEELAPVAERIGSGFAIFLHQRARVFRELGESGDLRAFEEFTRRDLELGQRLEQMWVSQSHLFLALAAEWQGRWDEALAHHRQAVSEEIPGAFEGWASGGLMLHLALAGREEGALEVFRGWEQRIPPPDGPLAYGAWVLALYAVEALALLGRRQEAARLAPYAERAVAEGTRIRVPDGRPVAAIAAQAAAADSRWDEAEELFAQALAQTEELPQRIHTPEVRRLHAHSLILWGDPAERDRAAAMLEEAAAGYASLGMSRHVELAEKARKG